MTNQPFERAVTDWLESGSDRTPPAAIDAVLLAVKTTPQERRGLLAPWRYIPMSPPVRFAAAALLALLAVGGAIYIAGSRTEPPLPTPAPHVPGSAIDTSSWQTFTSQRNGLAFRVPAGWTAIPAHWDGNVLIPDEVTSARAGGSMVFVAESHPLGPNPGAQPGSSASWYDEYFASLSPGPSACSDVRSAYAPTTIGVTHDSGYLFENYTGCGFGRAIVITFGPRFYTFTATATGSAVVDSELFAAWRSTIQLDPAHANDSFPPKPASSN